MKCKYLTIRSKNYIKYEYCRNQKKEITREICNKCKFKCYPEYANKKMKTKSSKLGNLERKRKSILTDNLDVCYLCPPGRKNRAASMHEIYKGANRIASAKNNFCVPLCADCHRHTEDFYEVLNFLQRECQKEFEKTHTREEFMKITGMSYL